jgi:hypothetical protein
MISPKYFLYFIMQRKSNKMNAHLFLFYATTVNIPMGPQMLESNYVKRKTNAMQKKDKYE